MSRFLSSQQVQHVVSFGRAVEQMLLPIVVDGERVLRWLRLRRETDSGYSVALIVVHDEGSDDFLDVYAFAPADPDAPVRVRTVASWADALTVAVDEFGAKADRFVSAGRIQDEYAALRRSGPKM